MKINDLISTRKLLGNKIITPLLVPSFSSTIFGIQNKDKCEDVSNVYEFIKDRTKVVLFSLYDIHKNYIKKEYVTEPDILFIDSGNYELSKYKIAGHKIRWSYKLYKNTLNMIDRDDKTILINYDIVADIKVQIKKAKNSFNNKYITDFIFKPYKEETVANIQNIIDNFDKINAFDILGISEKEIGDSLLNRCQNIINLRLVLNENKINLPIHIFGCLDPLSIILYFICGADIFDGLNWIKYGYYKDYALYDNNYSLLKGYYEFNESNSFKIMLVNNLNYLNELRGKLIDFSRNQDWSIFDLEPNIEKNIKLLLSQSGLDIMVD